MTTIKTAILLTVNECGEIIGMEDLYSMLGCFNRSHVRRQLQSLESEHAINVTHNGPGRGLKNIIRRKNRNSPDYPSRRDKHQRQVS